MLKLRKLMRNYPVLMRGNYYYNKTQYKKKIIFSMKEMAKKKHEFN